MMEFINEQLSENPFGIIVIVIGIVALMNLASGKYK
jgi:hypothetical protein